MNVMCEERVEYFDHYIGQGYVDYHVPDWVNTISRWRAMYDTFFQDELVDKTKVDIKGADIRGWRIDSNIVNIRLFDDMEQIDIGNDTYMRLYNEHADLDDLKRKTREVMRNMRLIRKKSKKELQEEYLEDWEED